MRCTTRSGTPAAPLLPCVLAASIEGAGKAAAAALTCKAAVARPGRGRCRAAVPCKQRRLARPVLALHRCVWPCTLSVLRPPLHAPCMHGMQDHWHATRGQCLQSHTVRRPSEDPGSRVVVERRVPRQPQPVAVRQRGGAGRCHPAARSLSRGRTGGTWGMGDSTCTY